MKLIAVTQPVMELHDRGERRDSLDQRLLPLLRRMNLSALPIPNHLPSAELLFSNIPLGGVVLTGGNDLRVTGGNVPERDEVEAFLVDEALKRGIPILGICRGMQFLFNFFGLPPQLVEGHIRTRHQAIFATGSREVNSYHSFGFRAVPTGFEILATAPDGTIEAALNVEKRILGLMWHPEREVPVSEEDLQMIRKHFH